MLSAEKTDVSDQYIESYFQLSEQISSYQKQIKELQKTLNSLDASKKENAGLRKTLESQISILQRNLAAAEASYRNLDDDEDDSRGRSGENGRITPAVRCRMQPMRSALSAGKHLHFSARHEVYAQPDKPQHSAA